MVRRTKWSELAPSEEERALRLHRDSIVIDACNTAEFDDDYVNRLVLSGVTCCVKTLSHQHGPREALIDVAEWVERIESYPDLLLPVNNVDSIQLAKDSGKVGIMYAFQSTRAIEDDLRLLIPFREMGVVVMQLTYNTRNYMGDGCLEPDDAGLSELGAAAVAKMNGLGIVVDLSHVGRRTSIEAIEASAQPVIFSHSNCRSLVANARNIPDELIRALGKNGGVVGIDVYLPHLTEDFDSAPSIDDVIDHVDHVVRLVGADHVGFGLDLGEGRNEAQYSSFKFPAGVYPTFEQREKNKCRGIETIEQFVNLTKGLVARGYSDSDVRNILGGNFLRVFGAAWKSRQQVSPQRSA